MAVSMPPSSRQSPSPYPACSVARYAPSLQTSACPASSRLSTRCAARYSIPRPFHWYAPVWPGLFLSARSPAPSRTVSPSFRPPRWPSRQRASFVDIDSELIIDRPTQNVKGAVLNQLDLIAKTTKADIFLLMPKQPDIESASFNGNLDTGMDPRLRCAIYGDLETMEHAKTRVLIMIDQIVSSRAPQPLAASAHC